jgi:hypothetical protein
MKEFSRAGLARVEVESQAVFDLITDVGLFSECNAAIESVLERPPALAEGVEWTVKMHPPHVPSWGSVSRVETLDRTYHRFAYKTRNADGNPSYTKWAWAVIDVGDAAEIFVSRDVHLKTLDRRIHGPVAVAPHSTYSYSYRYDS